MNPITPWKQRLDWNKPQSPSNTERLKAAQEEIRDLRKELEKMSRSGPYGEVKRLSRLLEMARVRVEHWRKVANAKGRT